MAQSRGTGIVLSKTICGEADYICNIFTKERGKERFLFKGLRKSKRRPGTASEPGTSLHIIYYYSHNSDVNTVSDITVISSRLGTREKSNRIFAQYYAVELINKTTGFSVPDEKLFLLLSSGLDILEKIDNIMEFLIFFTVRFLGIQGVLPNFSECSSCGQPLPDQFSLNSHNLHVLCSNCSGYGDILFSKECLIFLIECVSKKFNTLKSDPKGRENFPLLLSTIIRFIENYFSIKIKSSEMILTILKIK